ncbi:MAG: NAD(P)H-dependent oxidoreductase [Propionibacteriaceae bacterium]|jgi:chromate reductase|nr:NAD(P)H-dependent oxidoreductase [Propionibacteriaceae bacterium]
MKIAVLVGSLRRYGFNTMLADNIVSSATAQGFSAEFEYADLTIPLFNQDDENDPPAAVARLKSLVAQSDAVLMVCPEYNHSYTPILKNAIDWASRPYGESLWENKLVGIAGASPSMVGTALAQAHLRGVLDFLGAKTMGAPELFVAFAHKMFDESGVIVAEEKPFVDTFTKAFLEFVQNNQ